MRAPAVVARDLGTMRGLNAAMAVGAAMLAVAAGVISWEVTTGTPGYSFASDSPASTVVALAAGGLPVVVGLEAVRRGQRRLGWLLVGLGFAWLVSMWANPGAGSAIVFTIGLTLGSTYAAVVGHVLVEAIGPRADASRVGVIASGYLIFAFVLGVVPAMAFDEAASLCGRCPTNLISVGSAPAIVAAAATVGGALAVGWVAVVVAVVGVAYVRQGTVTRRRLAVVAVGGAIVLLLVAVEAARSALFRAPPTDPVGHGLRFGQALGLIVLTGGVTVAWVDQRRARARIARVVVDLGHAPPPGGLRDGLATAFGDPGLQVGYSVGGAVVDAGGDQMPDEPAAGRRRTAVVRDGEVIAEIDHRADVPDLPQRLGEAIAAARLGLEHERLTAVSRWHLSELKAARRRIVVHADAIRRDLERDLHDGAQQRIVALSVGLRLLPDDEVGAEAVAAAGRELRAALEELRAIAHGLYPRVLADEGLGAAIESLAETAPMPVRIEHLPDQRCTPDAEAAAYHAVADVVARAPGPISVAADAQAGKLVLELSAPAITPDTLARIGDRVGAADGSVVDGWSSDGRQIRVELPCAS